MGSYSAELSERVHLDAANVQSASDWKRKSARSIDNVIWSALVFHGQARSMILIKKFIHLKNSDLQ